MASDCAWQNSRVLQFGQVRSSPAGRDGSVVEVDREPIRGGHLDQLPHEVDLLTSLHALQKSVLDPFRPPLGIRLEDFLRPEFLPSHVVEIEDEPDPLLAAVLDRLLDLLRIPAGKRIRLTGELRPVPVGVDEKIRHAGLRAEVDKPFPRLEILAVYKTVLRLIPDRPPVPEGDTRFQPVEGVRIARRIQIHHKIRIDQVSRMLPNHQHPPRRHKGRVDLGRVNLRRNRTGVFRNPRRQRRKIVKGGLRDGHPQVLPGLDQQGKPNAAVEVIKGERALGAVLAVVMPDARVFRQPELGTIGGNRDRACFVPRRTDFVSKRNPVIVGPKNDFQHRPLAVFRRLRHPHPVVMIANRAAFPENGFPIAIVFALLNRGTGPLALRRIGFQPQTRPIGDRFAPGFHREGRRAFLDAKCDFDLAVGGG